MALLKLTDSVRLEVGSGEVVFSVLKGMCVLIGFGDIWCLHVRSSNVSPPVRVSESLCHRYSEKVNNLRMERGLMVLLYKRPQLTCDEFLKTSQFKTSVTQD